MDNKSGSLTCTVTCWGIGGFAGLAGMAGLMVLGDWTLLQGLFAAFVIFLLVGAALSWLMCSPLPPPRPAGTAGRAEAPAPAPERNPAPAPRAAPKPAAAADPQVGSTQLSGESELAARKGNWRYGEAAPAAAPEEAQPETLSAARGGKADDLKLLKGVGPKLEQTLNELGFYHFDQIAAWTEAEVAWVDKRLKFKGRIERDGWIEQAKILADGGETEFSKRKK